MVSAGDASIVARFVGLTCRWLLMATLCELYTDTQGQFFRLLAFLGTGRRKIIIKRVDRVSASATERHLGG